MYNYLVNFRPVLPGAPLQLGALSARLVRLWVNPASTVAQGDRPLMSQIFLETRMFRLSEGEEIMTL